MRCVRFGRLKRHCHRNAKTVVRSLQRCATFYKKFSVLLLAALLLTLSVSEQPASSGFAQKTVRRTLFELHFLCFLCMTITSDFKPTVLVERLSWKCEHNFMKFHHVPSHTFSLNSVVSAENTDTSGWVNIFTYLRTGKLQRRSPDSMLLRWMSSIFCKRNYSESQSNASDRVTSPVASTAVLTRMFWIVIMKCTEIR